MEDFGLWDVNVSTSVFTLLALWVVIVSVRTGTFQVHELARLRDSGTSSPEEYQQATAEVST